MTHLIGSPAPATRRLPHGGSRPPGEPAEQGGGVARAARTGLLAGAGAALGGLALTAVPLLALWVVTPYVQDGARGSLHLACCLWLLAHGADLVRTTGGGPGAGTAPVGVAPLLLTAAVLVLLCRAGRRLGRALPGQGGHGPAAGLLGLCCGYGAVTAAVLPLACSSGLLRARPVPALAAALLVAAAAGAAGLRSAVRLRSPRPHRPGPPRWAFPAAAGEPLLRAVAAACAALLGGGALVLGTALLGHGGAAGRSILALAPDTPGQCGLLLLCLALYPNAVVWSAAYTLGPGFAVGTGTVVAPYGTVLGRTPELPLLAALPDPAGSGAPTPLGWAALALPPLAGAALAAVLGRAAAGARWHTLATAVAAVAGALLTGAAMAGCAAASGGALGAGRLAALGPSPWQTGLAAAAWTAVVGLPGTLLARLLLRRRR